MSDDRLTIEIALTPADVYDPLLWCWPNAVRWTSIVVLLLAARPIVSFWHSAVSLWEKEPQWLALFLAVSAGFVWWLVRPLVQIRSGFKRYPVMAKRRLVSLSSDGVHVEAEDFIADYRWSVFTKIVEMPKTFMFMQTRANAIYIPKRCLNGSSDIVDLRRLIRENFRNEVRLRSD